MWREGTIGIPQSVGTNHIIHFWIKLFYEPSGEYGLNGGKISKLSLKLNSEWIANYDRG